jgi:hypothetical protein
MGETAKGRENHGALPRFRLRHAYGATRSDAEPVGDAGVKRGSFGRVLLLAQGRISQAEAANKASRSNKRPWA